MSYETLFSVVHLFSESFALKPSIRQVGIQLLPCILYQAGDRPHRNEDLLGCEPFALTLRYMWRVKMIN